jgi:hypothetical protein
MHPTYKGATFLYNAFIKEYVVTHLHHVDSALDQVDPSKILSAAVSAASGAINSAKEKST